MLKKKKNIHSVYAGKIGVYEYSKGLKEIYISNKKLQEWRRKGVMPEGKAVDGLIHV